MNLLDLIFPKYCVNCKKFGDYLCPDCFARISFDTKNICVVCGKPSIYGITHAKCMGKYKINGAFTCIVYNSVSKKLIYQFKYKPHLKNLSKLMSELMYESLIQNEEFMKTKKGRVVFVPIPLHKSKLRKRGYNQSEILAKELSRKFNIPVLNFLERIKETKTQVGLDRLERKENIRNAFVQNEKLSGNFKNSKVILVDDVLTTGSTFSETARVLKQCGFREVWAVALAKES